MGHVYAIDARRSPRATRKTTLQKDSCARDNQSNSSTSNTPMDGFYKQTSHEQSLRIMIPDNELVI